MNSEILNIQAQQFIDEHLNADLSRLVFKGSPIQTLKIQDLIEQIESKRKCRMKLPTWYGTSNVYYPNKLNIEQTSSETTASYKSKLISGDSLIDITGGFGVDAFYFAKQFNTVIHCEINSELSDIVSHNFKQLNTNTIKTVAQDGIAYLNLRGFSYDWIFVDPSRRHESKGKVFMLKDCLPNVPVHLETLFKYTNRVLIKTSPLLDISLGLSELQNVKSIHVVAINNEVKELLWLLHKDYDKDITITTVNIKNETHNTFSFSRLKEKELKIEYAEPLVYLYEPNAAILKSGGFQSIAYAFKLKKLHRHSHLYTSDKRIEFPGRVFQINQRIVYNKKNLKSLSIDRANITTRNFPESVKDIRKKYNISDGGDNYLFFTTNHLDQRIVLMCSKLP